MQINKDDSMGERLITSSSTIYKLKAIVIDDNDDDDLVTPTDV